jgi:flagellar hook protein FlgE
MDVIGNNIANVNTVGFKSGRVIFSDVFSQLSRGAGAPNADTGRGGTNPMQVGLGANVYSIDNQMTRGSVQRTDNPTDLAIDGEGFFVVRGGRLDTYKFTRAGNFTLDAVGNLVTASGLNVMGWQLYTYDRATDSYVFDTEQPLEEINIYADTHNGNKRILAPQATTFAEFTGNLDADAVDGSAASASTVPFFVYDEIGNKHDINIRFTAASTNANTDRTWNWEIVTGSGYTVTAGGTGGTITFGTGSANAKNGIVTAVNGTTPPAAVNITITPSAPSIASPLTVSLDLTKMTQYAYDTNVKSSKSDGYPPGEFSTFSIGSDGVVSAVYSNGKMRPLAQIALASFDNPAGLLKEGDNLFSQTTNSGAFTRGVRPTYSGTGQLAPGTLEMSNVDLSREFSDMIVTQRGFQANTRIITTSDEMLQELVNIKR